MTTAEPLRREQAPGERAPSDPTGPGPRRIRSALAVPAVTAVVALLLLSGGALMRVPKASGFLGPQFFPLTVGALLMLTALVSAAWALRRGSARIGRGGTGGGRDTAEPPSPRGDWRTLTTMAATLLAHLALLQPLGWLLSGTLLFWGISHALDRRHPLFDLCVAAALAGVVQLVFSGLLEVALPAGLLGKVL
ncbi:hypothetical protein GCM10027294_07060 [Marinactinospora endophytica]